MVNIKYIEQFKNTDFMIDLIEIFFIILFTFYTFIKIANINKITVKDFFIIALSNIFLAIITRIIQLEIFTYLSWVIVICLISVVNCINFKKEITYTILVTILSLSISYVIYTVSVMISFFPIKLFGIENRFISLQIIICLYIFLIIQSLRIKKLKYGISFLEKKVQNRNLNILLMNVGVISLHSLIILQSYSGLGAANVGINFSIIIFVEFITIKFSFELHYKQNLLEKDLKETKDELEAKKKEVEKLEKENLEFSKTSHSLAHKQKALEYRLSKLVKLGKINEDEEKDIKKELENISEEMYKEPEDVELVKTDIPSIDNMFSYMQSECIKNNIKFELQVVGNIHYMVNNLISENDLEILIADHIKDAIIAINHSDNLNRSILVRIGKIDNVYSLYIYDSGIEFTKEVLDNLGKKPITTYADTGGTGMGFMNSFDTLNKTKASLIINEIGKSCEDNYTKVLIFKFDNQNEFKVNSYKNEAIV